MRKKQYGRFVVIHLAIEIFPSSSYHKYNNAQSISTCCFFWINKRINKSFKWKIYGFCKLLSNIKWTWI